MGENLYYVVDSINNPRRLFRTFGEAKEYFLTLDILMDNPKIYHGFVNEVFEQADGSLSYDDLSHEFVIVNKLT